MLASSNKIAKSTVYNIINETCKGIYEALSTDYTKFPTTSTWRNTAQKFGEVWQLPGCLSAIDGKHIRIRAPDKSGSLFFSITRKHLA